MYQALAGKSDRFANFLFVLPPLFKDHKNKASENDLFYVIKEPLSSIYLAMSIALVRFDVFPLAYHLLSKYLG